MPRRADGLPVKVVAATTKSGGYAIISRPDIASVKDLKGKRLAINTFGPLEVTNTGGKMDVYVNATGGGPSGQTGAIIMGLARALTKYDQTLEAPLRGANFMTRDSRMKERKKYGQRGARRRFQFSKR